MAVLKKVAMKRSVAPAIDPGVREVDIPYKPRSQFIPYHNRSQRWSVLVCHRRFGKTVGCINDLIKGALTCPLPEPRFAYIAPTYGQAKDVAWGYLKFYALGVPGAVPNETELRVDFPNGGRVRLYGADNYDRMRGIYLDGVIPDEYGDQDPRAWPEVIRPALSDRKGWATFIGTPRGKNHFKDLWDKAQDDDDWFKLMLKASQTGILDEEELVDARKHMTAEQYAAEYECSFYGSVMGSYYGSILDEMEASGYIGDFGHNPRLAVHTAWDTGGTTGIWCFQMDGQTPRVIKYLEGQNLRADAYVRMLKENNWTLGKHIVPADADREKEITAIGWKETLVGLGLNEQDFIVLPSQTSVNDGIENAKFTMPTCRFDERGTRDGVSGLRNYRRDWDDKRKVFREYPRHDWASHPADAFRHLALGIGQVGGQSNWDKPIKYKTNWVV
jgi:hypothetical protein